LFPSAMLLLTETTLFHLDHLNRFSADVCAAKDDYAGMGKTKDWAEKLATSKLLRPQLESLRTESHRRVSSITTSTAVSRISKVTSARANPTGSPHPTNNVQGNLEEPTTAFLDEDDSLEREAAFKATKKPGARHTTSAVFLSFFMHLHHTHSPLRIYWKSVITVYHRLHCDQRNAHQ
jgi:hypothetical protein